MNMDYHAGFRDIFLLSSTSARKEDLVKLCDLAGFSIQVFNSTVIDKHLHELGIRHDFHPDVALLNNFRQLFSKDERDCCVVVLQQDLYATTSSVDLSNQLR